MKIGRIAAPSVDGEDNVARQAELLRERLGSAMKLVDQLAGTPELTPPSQPVTERAIRNLIKIRRDRAKFFDAELFADPAWDMLLELYACHLAQHRISVTALCAAACVPATTALRWIAALEAKELIERRADPTDGRRYFMSLTSAGRITMEAYFRTVPIAASLM